MPVVSVVFDVGETLLDDSREFGAWADWIGDLVRHEALCYRVEVGDLRRLAVAAAG